MRDDDEIRPEDGELGHRMLELHIEREQRTLLAILIVCGILLVASLLVVALFLTPPPRWLR
jgi:hypothetical protein